MPDDDTRIRAIEPWTFGGVRLSKSDKFIEMWLPAGATEDNGALYYGTRGTGRKYVIGGIYNVEVARGERVTRFGEPTWTGKYAGDDERLEYSRADGAARVHYQLSRDHANAVKADALDAAMAPLVELAGKCRTRTETDALIATVMRAMLSTPHKGGRIG